MSSRLFPVVFVVLFGIAAPTPLWAQRVGDPSTYRRTVEAPYTPFVIQLPGPGDTWRGAGEYLKNKEEAALLKEKVRQEKLKTRQSELEHWEWERTWKAGLLNRIQEVDDRERLIRAMNHAPFTEITSGHSLNVLLEAMKPHSLSKVATLAAEPLKPETLDAVNTNFGTSGNLGLLKGGKVVWPPALGHPAYAGTCKRIDAVVADIYKRLCDSQKVDARELRQMSRLAEDLKSQHAERFRQRLAEFDLFQEFRMLRGFVGQLEDALKVLHGDPTNAVLYLRPVEGRNAAEVAAYLIQHGLRIAPPTVGKGGDRHYRILHEEFVKLMKQLDPEAGAVKPSPAPPR